MSEAPPVPPPFSQRAQAQVSTGRGVAVREWYTALTKIRVRSEASVSSTALGSFINQGEVFEVNQELAVPGQKYLKLAKQNGWVFTQGIAGEWAGKMIVA